MRFSQSQHTGATNDTNAQQIQKEDLPRLERRPISGGTVPVRLACSKTKTSVNQINSRRNEYILLSEETYYSYLLSLENLKLTKINPMFGKFEEIVGREFCVENHELACIVR